MKDNGQPGSIERGEMAVAKYENKGGQPREKCMIAAYALVNHYGAKQTAVADVMGCSQGTIANWVKEVGYQDKIAGLEKELATANDYIQNLADRLKLIEYNPGRGINPPP